MDSQYHASYDLSIQIPSGPIRQQQSVAAAAAATVAAAVAP